MAVGLEIINPDLTTLITSKGHTLMYTQKAALQAVGGTDGDGYYYRFGARLNKNSLPIAFNSGFIACQSKAWISTDIALQPLNNGNEKGVVNLYKFDTDSSVTVYPEDLGLEIFDSNGRLAFSTKRFFLKALNYTVLPPTFGRSASDYWSFVAPEGVDIAVVIGGGGHRAVNEGGGDLGYYQAFFRTVENKVEIKGDYSGWDWGEQGSGPAGYNVGSNLWVLVVDVTDIAKI